MGVLYIVSVEEGAGKTALCAGIAVNLLNQGKNIGYLRPQTAGKSPEGDVAFMKRVLRLEDAVNAPDIVKGRDIVIVENTLGPTVTDARNVIGAAREMQAAVIAVEPYAGDESKNLNIFKWFGDNLLGAVLNKVPVSRLKSVKEKAAAQFTAAGIKLLGVMPENRVLMAVSVGELAEIVKGKIINYPEKSGELVENYMLGAMVVGSGADYFNRKSNKAAIIHQDRPDMQLAALETSLKCLVLSGGSASPIYNVMHKASGRGVPIITTDAGTTDIVSYIEEALSDARISQEKKLAGLGEFVRQNLDMKAVA